MGTQDEIAANSRICAAFSGTASADDCDLYEELIQQYETVRCYCRDNPAPEFIPLLLNSFGNGTGWGVYQCVEDAFRSYSSNEVIPHLQQALISPIRSVRYWAAEIAANFPSSELLSQLTDLLNDENSDVRIAALIALSPFDPQIINPIFLRHLEIETDSDITDLIKNQLSGFDL